VDLSCIISSGDLELYVLGLLPAEEAYKVEQLALLFPEVKAEIDAISAALEGVSAAASAGPAPAVKESLMQKLAQLKSEETRTAAPVIPMERVPEETGSAPAAPAVPLRRSSWALAASLGGLIVALGALLYLASLNRQKGAEIARLNGAVDTLNRHYTSQQRQVQAWEQTVQMMQSTDYRKIALASVPGKPAARADVFWKPATGEVFVMDVSLPPAPAGHQYQLWAIVNGQPVDAGMLGDTGMQVQKMKTFGAADAFAITLEKEGGSPTPTMSALYVMGKTS
jgi:anti-sigma-K factor RskA